MSTMLDKCLWMYNLCIRLSVIKGVVRLKPQNRKGRPRFLPKIGRQVRLNSWLGRGRESRKATLIEQDQLI